jgi:mannose-6-phosphate isomerase-like protein (cupin superfamily)
MNAAQVRKALAAKYPAAHIVLNNENDPSEIVCEVDPTTKHPEYSVAVAIVDRSVPHFHKKTTEIYTVIKGTLELLTDGIRIILHENDSYTVKPGVVHSATGDATWIRAESNPGWTAADHFIKK